MNELHINLYASRIPGWLTGYNSHPGGAYETRAHCDAALDNARQVSGPTSLTHVVQRVVVRPKPGYTLRRTNALDCEIVSAP